jgi:hypothetical protein
MSAGEPEIAAAPGSLADYLPAWTSGLSTPDELFVASWILDPMNASTMLRGGASPMIHVIKDLRFATMNDEAMMTLGLREAKDIVERVFARYRRWTVDEFARELPTTYSST